MSNLDPELPPTLALRRPWFRFPPGVPCLGLPFLMRVRNRISPLGIVRGGSKSEDLNTADISLQVSGKSLHALVTTLGRLFETLQADRLQGRVYRISPPTRRHWRPAPGLHDHLVGIPGERGS